MNKCIASKDGVCQNIKAYGLKCEGYSTKCKVKKAYDTMERMAKKAVDMSRKHYGFVSDKEEGTE